MHEAVKLGATHIIRVLNRNQTMDSTQVERFTETLTSILCKKFEGHWYPDNPQKGQAYRCIRIENSEVDDCVLQACVRSGLRCSQLYLPRDMSVWIDPDEVSCRFGDKCRPFTVKPPEPEVPKKDQSFNKSDLETSDYHSDTSSETTSTPSECSSEDEEKETIADKEKAPPPTDNKLGVCYYYSMPTFYYNYTGNNVGFVQNCQPVPIYYFLPKYDHNVQNKAYRKWKSKKFPPSKKY
ncbi:maternal B9.15 protein-like [Pyxicephalus adspersus]|uniref:Anti-proliferative protein domain-containing protein n=1 Tax=Pyxicephalus adspersus TaxID=30357 RepID=A0AAV2ZPE4_PYXAD|nr:TPA: hypothetical protein GDO54_003302 [Pyxicephalus adspersus]